MTNGAPSDDNPEVRVAARGVTITMWRMDGCTVTDTDILAQFDWLLKTGGWKANVLRWDGTAWVRRNKAVATGWQTSNNGGGYYLGISVDKGAWLTPDQFDELVEQFRDSIAALYVGVAS